MVVQLFGVQLNDELFFNRLVDLFALGNHAHGDRETVFANFEPARDRAVQDVKIALDVEVLASHVL